MLPMRDVTRPAVLSGQTNGELPDSLLVSIPGLSGGYTVRLIGPAARAFRALRAAAAAAGHILNATSTVDSYRPYSVQESTFRARYTLTVLSGRPSALWQGKRWYLRAGEAVAAVPGTSNHGLGLAIDIASVDPALAWLVANEERFGFSHELESEPWHIHYWAGDAIPAAVLAYEKGEDMALTSEDVGSIWSAGFGSGTNRKTAGQLLSGAYSAAVAGQAGVAALATAVTHLGDVIAAGGGTVDSAAILAGFEQQFAAFREQVEADIRDAIADEAEGGAAAVRSGASS